MRGWRMDGRSLTVAVLIGGWRVACHPPPPIVKPFGDPGTKEFGEAA